MNAEFIRGLLRHQPFEPFEVFLSNGDSYLVKHPEVAFLAGSRLMIYQPETDSVVFCSLLHIAEIKMGQVAS